MAEVEPESETFRFSFQLAYDEDVESLLYDINTYGIDIPAHSIQRKCKTSVYCLLCNTQLETTFTKEELLQHLATHSGEEDQKALDVFHESFMNLEKELQIQQVFFLPRSERNVECLICTKSIPIKCVRDHTKAREHSKRMQKHSGEYFEEAQVNIGKITSNFSEISISKDSNAEKSGQSKPKRKKAKKNGHPSNLIVTTAVKIDEKKEKLPKKQKQDAKNQETIKSRTFINTNRVNIDKNETVSDETDLFDDSDDNQDNELFYHECNKFIYCLLCCDQVLNFSKHCTTVTHDRRLKSLQSGVGNDYNRITAYYNLWDWKLTNVPGTIRKYFVSRDYNSVKCLLCKDVIPFSNVSQHIRQFPCAFLKEDSPLYSNEFNWHQLKLDFLESKKGIEKCYAEEVQLKIYPFPEFFDSSIKVYTLQMRGDSDVYCLACNTTVNDISNHLQDAGHVLNVNKKNIINMLLIYHRFFTSEDVEIQKMQVYLNVSKKRLYQCVGCKKYFGISAFVAHTMECHFVGAPGRNIKLDTSIKNKENRGYNTADNIGQVEVRHMINDEELCYDDETLITLYPTCNTPRGQRRPGILTIQKRSEFEKYCLPCGTSVYTRGVEHISGEKHQKMLEVKRRQLEQYHRFWMSQTPELQLLQIYFNPNTAEMMKCLGCRNRIYFGALRGHLKCVQYIKKMQAAYALPERLTQFEVNYEKEIVRRYFYGLHYDLSRDILGTHVPVAYVCKKFFYCLLCPDPEKGRMLRNVDPWKWHLQKYHCNSGIKREKQMEAVIKYHEFWAGQTLERQFYLAHFTLRPDGLRCDQGHLLQLHEAVEHIETPDICELKRIVVDERKQREDMQRPRDDDDANGDGHNPNQNPKTNKPNKYRDNKPKEHKFVELYSEATKQNQQEQQNDGLPPVKLPVYQQEHAQFFTFVNPEVPDEVICNVCDESMRNSLETVRHHVSTPQHGQKTRKAGREKFYCDVCMKTLSKPTAWLNHLDESKHVQSVEKLPATRRDAMSEIYCEPCHLVIYGDAVAKIRHEGGGDSGKKKKPNTLTEKMKDLLASLTTIEEAALGLVAKCAKFREDSRSKVEECINDLETLIKESYPNCKIYQFGSRVAGFVVEDSDLDLFVDVDNKYLGKDLDYHEERKVVLEVRRLLKTQPKMYIDLHTVLSARVPIAKVVHAPTDLDCDLSFINGLSVENTRLISFYSDLQPAFAQALLILKEWGSRMTCKLKNDMTSYALCMMTIFSMQVDGQLPSVNQLREASTFDVININGWDTVDYSKLDVDGLKKMLKEPKSVGDVVRNFFKYYGNFNYRRHVACPMLGRTFDVKLFDNKGKGTPEEMHTYRNKVEVDPDAQFRVSCHMFVQDPFDLGHNLTKLANQKFVNDFQNLCLLSYAHIQ